MWDSRLTTSNRISHEGITVFRYQISQELNESAFISVNLSVDLYLVAVVL